MSHFRLGQRVRIIACKTRPAFVGMEAFIRSHLYAFRLQDSGDPQMMYDIEIIGSHKYVLPHGVKYWVADPEVLVPITYTGNQVLSWAKCLWKPGEKA